MLKKILIKSTISLCAGIASTIGMKLVSTVWDKCASDVTIKKKEQACT